MLALMDIVARVRAAVPAARHVAHGFAADMPPATPAVFIYPLSEAAAASPTLGTVRQVVTVRIAIEIVVGSPRGAGRGEGAAGEADIVRNALLLALVGWQPDWADTPLEHRAGRLAQLEAGWASWRDEYETSMLRSL